MKRFISIILAFVMCIGFIPVMAKDNMESILLNVKGKIEIPAELTEFSSSVNTYREKTTYNFSWYNKERSKEINVSCSDKGIIGSYSYYSDDMYVRGKKTLPAVTKEEAGNIASQFLHKILPEAVGEDDYFILDNVSVNLFDTGAGFTVSFLRHKKGVRVEGQYANIEIVSGKDLIITSYYGNYNPEIVYEEEKGEIIKDALNIYKEKFPSELVYEKKSYKEDKFNLVYRIKDNKKGYISAYNGEEKELYFDEENYFSKNESVMDSMLSGSAGGFTDAELKELENNSNFVKENEIITFLKSDSVFSYNDKMTLENIRYYKDKEKYYAEASFIIKDTKSVRITLNAITKELLNLYFYDYNKDNEIEISQSKKEAAEKNIDKLIEKYSNEEKENIRKGKVSVNGKYVSVNYERLYNNIPVVDNGISVTFNGESGKLVSYRKNYNDGEFEETDGIINCETAYENIIREYPLIYIYLNTGEEYSLCFTLDADIMIKIGAKDGKPLNIAEKISYKDIENHWVKAIAEELKLFEIMLKGDELKPEDEINQLDMLRLFASAVYYSSYNSYTPDDLYKNLIRQGILTKEERKENEPVLREDAFMYLVKMLGFDEVAKLKDIFKTEFKDADSIDKEKIGYISILSGMKVINGNEGYINPKAYLTRAEALSMIYNYLKY